MQNSSPDNGEATTAGRGVNATQLDRHDGDGEGGQSWAMKNAAATVRNYRLRDGVDKRESFPTISPLVVSVDKEQSVGSLREGNDYAKTIKIQPSLYTAVMRDGLAKVARVLILAQLVDTGRNGHVSLADLRTFVDEQGVMGKRQLRKLLQEGRGIFWDQTRTHIDTYAPHVIAAKIGVDHFSGRPVFIPSTAVIGSTKEFKATIYAAFHAGREWQGRGVVTKPIARETMKGIMGASPSAQQDYDALADVRTHKNIALFSTQNAEEAAWQVGKGMFQFKDWNGKNGKKGNVSYARQLPNDYKSKLQTASRADTVRFNARLDTKMGNMGINAGDSVPTGDSSTRQMVDKRAVKRLYAKDGNAVSKLDNGFWQGRGGVWFEHRAEQRTPYPYVGSDLTDSFPVV